MRVRERAGPSPASTQPSLNHKLRSRLPSATSHQELSGRSNDARCNPNQTVSSRHKDVSGRRGPVTDHSATRNFAWFFLAVLTLFVRLGRSCSRPTAECDSRDECLCWSCGSDVSVARALYLTPAPFISRPPACAPRGGPARAPERVSRTFVPVPERKLWNSLSKLPRTGAMFALISR